MSEDMETLSLGRRFVRPLGTALASLVELLGECRSLSRERRTLDSLDEWILKDLGLTRADVERELGKPFWRR
jgi:uncharacterized protein YjiS (DUF1127 family)